MDKINVLFPLEVINRDLDYRLFLAAEAAHEGNRIFVGQHDAIHRLSKSMEGGIYLGQYAFRSLFPLETTERYRDIKSRGFTLIHLHEEGAIYYGGPDDWKKALQQRIDPRVLDETDWVCTWGDFQRDAFLELAPRCAEHVRTTGHPRFDLLRPEYRGYYEAEVGTLPRPKSPFVLVNTNLVLANSCIGLDDTFSKVRGYDASSPASRVDFFGKWAHNNRILVGFVELVNRLSLAFPSLHFVLRPHPAENMDYYRTIFRGISNVSVMHHGPVIPWLLASELLLHNGCTTGMEAFLADKPVINYMSMPEGKYDCFLPNVFGARCGTPEEVIDRVRAITTDGGHAAPHAVLPDQARSLVANFDAPSLPRVRAVLSECEADVRRRRQIYSRRGFRAREAVHDAASAARKVARSFLPARRKRANAYAQIFYGFERDNLESRLARVQRIVGKKLTLEVYGPELFSIEVA